MEKPVCLGLLPWRNEEKPACVPFDGTRTKLHDVAEEELLVMGEEVRDAALRTLRETALTRQELAFVIARLVECLADALLVAEARGGRVIPYDE